MITKKQQKVLDELATEFGEGGRLVELYEAKNIEIDEKFNEASRLGAKFGYLTYTVDLRVGGRLAFVQIFIGRAGWLETVDSVKNRLVRSTNLYELMWKGMRVY